jgi:MFS family permease
MNKIYQAIAKTFPAFRGRDFRLYFIGQFISWAGTWLQNVTLGWFVWKMTHSGIWVGLTAAIPLFVCSLLTPMGGIIADRFDKRNVLYVIQVLAMIQAFILGGLAMNNYAPLWAIVSLSFMLGAINAVDGPTRNSLIPEIVRKEEIASSAALNTAMITSSQAFGPALAGLLIPFCGIGGTFIINGVSFIAVIVTLWMMLIENKSKKHVEHPLKMFWAGIKYSVFEPRIRLCVVLTGLIGMFGFSYRAMLPIVTTEIFKSGPFILGCLTAAVGVGACAGAVIVSAKSKKVPFNMFVITGSIMTGTSLILFSLTSNIILGIVFLFFAGAGFTLSSSTVRAELQVIVEDKMRGRAIGLAMMAFFAGMALGNSLEGILAKQFGPSVAISSNGIALLVLVATIVFVSRKIKLKSV